MEDPGEDVVNVMTDTTTIFIFALFSNEPVQHLMDTTLKPATIKHRSRIRKALIAQVMEDGTNSAGYGGRH